MAGRKSWAPWFQRKVEDKRDTMSFNDFSRSMLRPALMRLSAQIHADASESLASED